MGECKCQEGIEVGGLWDVWTVEEDPGGKTRTEQDWTLFNTGSCDEWRMDGSRGPNDEEEELTNATFVFYFFIWTNQQLMKPVYQGCMEKGIAHVAEAAVGGVSSPAGNSSGGQRRSGKQQQQNGKAKRS